MYGGIVVICISIILPDIMKKDYAIYTTVLWYIYYDRKPIKTYKYHLLSLAQA